MENKDILLAAQKNKERGKEYENRISSKGTLLGTLIALIVGVILFIVELCTKGTWNYGFLSIACISMGTESLFDGCKMHKVFFIVYGIVSVLLGVFFMLAYIAGLVA